MKYSPKETLTEQEIRTGLKFVVRDGLTSQSMVTLSGGVFLIAFALKLGASNFVIGALAAIPFLAQLMQIPSIFLTEKYRNRRLITMISAIFARPILLFVALIPMLFPLKFSLIALILGMISHSSFNAVSGSSWNPWMRDLVPDQILGTFFSRRLSLAIGISIPLGLSAGYFIDFWENKFPAIQLYGFSIIFALACFSGMLGIYFISRIPEPQMRPIAEKINIFKLILAPFKNINFKRLIIFLGSWHFAVNLAAPFFTVYMLKRLQLSTSIVISLTILSQSISVIFLRIWGGISDRFSNKSVLSVSGPLFMFCIFAWTFTTLPEKHFLTMPMLIALHILMGISTAGVTISVGNLGLKLAPKGEATAFLAAISFVSAIAAGTAPLLGGLAADFLTGHEILVTLKWIRPGGHIIIPALDFKQWDFFFFFSFLLGTYSIHRLAFVKEEGEVGEKVVISEFFSALTRPVRNLSSAGGVAYMVTFPFSVIKFMSKIGKNFLIGNSSDER